MTSAEGKEEEEERAEKKEQMERSTNFSASVSRCSFIVQFTLGLGEYFAFAF